MDLKVRNIDFNYDAESVITSVNVRFDTYGNANSNDSVVLSGHVRIDKADYDKNATDLVALGALVKARIKEKINA